MADETPDADATPRTRKKWLPRSSDEEGGKQKYYPPQPEVLYSADGTPVGEPAKRAKDALNLALWYLKKVGNAEKAKVAFRAALLLVGDGDLSTAADNAADAVTALLAPPSKEPPAVVPADGAVCPQT